MPGRSAATPQTGGLAGPGSRQARERRGRSIEGLVGSAFLLEELRASCQGRAPEVSSDDSDLSNTSGPRKLHGTHSLPLSWARKAVLAHVHREEAEAREV